MSVNKKIVIINNEKISNVENSFCCDNIDMKSIPEGLDKFFFTTLIARKSNISRSHPINIKKIYTASNIINFLFNIFKTFKHKETKYLIISITPYTFFAYLLLYIFRKKIFLYLRSSGHEEYKAILGFVGPLIYNLMYTIVTFSSEIITCHKRLFRKKKNHLVFPSQINYEWLKNTNKPLLDKPRLLYIGRIKVEKGIFSLVKLLEKLDIDFDFSIVGKKENLNTKNKKIKFLGYGYSSNPLIEIYDNHNILILPSFTEAYPKVIIESLSRVRPVIIFEEINYVVQEQYGIFVAKRNAKSLLEMINYIMLNYTIIQNKISKNKLPTEEDFLLQIKNILN